MSKHQLSTKQQIGLVLGVLLVFSLVLTFAGYMALGQSREKIADFAHDGATVTGLVTDKYIHVVRGVWVYWVDVSFNAADGRTHKGSEVVANTIWDGMTVGQPVQITYVKSKPEWFYVPGGAPTERDVSISDGMFEYGMVASLLFLIGLIVFIMWSRGGGTPAGRNTAPDATREFSFRPPRSAPRSGFGTRGQ
jgi:hypothetical protein